MTDILKDIVSFFVFAVVTPFRRNRKAVLVYHSVDYISEADDPYKMNVRPALFEKHMEHIAAHKELFTVTFDDGFGGVYRNAFPVMKKHGIRGVVFLTTDLLDSKVSMSKYFGKGHYPGPMTWDQAKEMSSSGFRIGSHTVTHGNLGKLDDRDLSREMTESARKIEAMIGKKPDLFSYPFGNAGSFTEKTGRVLEEAGYSKGYTNIMGMDNSSEEPYSIRRIRVYGTDNMFRFRMKVAGSYNWVDRLTGLFGKTQIGEIGR